MDDYISYATWPHLPPLQMDPPQSYDLDLLAQCQPLGCHYQLIETPQLQNSTQLTQKPQQATGLDA